MLAKVCLPLELKFALKLKFTSSFYLAHFLRQHQDYCNKETTTSTTSSIPETTELKYSYYMTDVAQENIRSALFLCLFH